MIDPRSHQLEARSDNCADYEELFVPRVHRLIKLGYDRLPAARYSSDEETAITGDLSQEIDAVLDSPPASEPWIRYFSVYDDPPVNQPKRRGKKRRRGKQRKRVDIRIDSSLTSPRARFRFECKRLSATSHTAKDYLGEAGLGCFLRADYAAEDERAGMLGYVQTDDEQVWANSIQTELEESPAKYAVLPASPWRHAPVIDELPHTCRSGHRRGRGRKPIEIYHTLLRFC